MLEFFTCLPRLPHAGILKFGIHLTFACLPCTSTLQGLPIGRDFGI
jgi:hypothetical protein